MSPYLRSIASWARYRGNAFVFARSPHSMRRTVYLPRAGGKFFDILADPDGEPGEGCIPTVYAGRGRCPGETARTNRAVNSGGAN